MILGNSPALKTDTSKRVSLEHSDERSTKKQSFIGATTADCELMDEASWAKEEQGTVNWGKYTPPHYGFTWQKGTKQLYTVVVSVCSGFLLETSLKHIMQPEVTKDGSVLRVKTQLSKGMTSVALLGHALAEYTESDNKKAVMCHAMQIELQNIKQKMGIAPGFTIGSVAEISLPYVCDPDCEFVHVTQDGKTGSTILYVVLAKKMERAMKQYAMKMDVVDLDCHEDEYEDYCYSDTD